MNIFDVQIDPDTGDIVLDGGDINHVEGADCVAQEIKQKLSKFRGENFANPEDGMPYWDEVLRTNATIDSLASLLRSAVMDVANVLSVGKITMEHNTETGAVTVEIQNVKTTFGTIPSVGTTI